ncbi:23S rRNA (uracil(1939)-C(5))-methyltransferase RlmD, partial [Pseudomonas aeruginosa]|nr:23S rRNA (uracil(1939)-C(5))-methyltransferase RlmD [Pseudomonas aeruginosa]
MARNKGGLRFQPSGGARGPAIPVGKKQRLRIERLAHDGRGIAHEAGMTWFVSGGLPGEELEARVLGARSKVVEARSERLFGSSELRRREPCSVAGRCGGCTLQHLGHAEQLALKQRTLQEQLQRFAGIEPEEWAPPLVGPEFGYRRRARIAVRWEPKSRRLEVGFRASSSQEIVAFDECLVLVPALQTIAQALPVLLRGFRKPEAIGHVELFHGTASALLLRHTVALAVEDRRRLEDFCAEHQAQLWLQGADEPRPVEPAAELGYALDDWKLTLAYRPGDFVQVNAPVNRLMVRQALEWLAPGAEERVIALVCGLGNFSLP